MSFLTKYNEIKIMKIKSFLIAITAVTLILSYGCITEKSNYQLKVTGLDQDCSYIPVHCNIQLPEQFSNVPQEDITVELRNKNTGTTGIPGQIIVDDQGDSELWWIVPNLKANSSNTWIATLTKNKNPVHKKFSW